MRPIDADELLKQQYRMGFGQVSVVSVGAIEKAPTLTPQNEWVSVEERLPEEKQRVIVRCERVGTSVGWILWGNWMTDIGPGAGKVTHWMPLPAPPDRRPVSREQVERMRGEWKHYLPPLGAGNVQCRCTKCGRTPDVETPFCAWCGAPTTDEAAQMVMERLEALHGET